VQSTAAGLKDRKIEAMNDMVSAADGRNRVIERAFDLPFGYCATFVWRGRDEPIEVHWSPDMPLIRKPRPQRKFLAAYDPARREFSEDISAVLGGRVLILDTDLKKERGHEVIVPPTQH
jgi:hypothetical protein